MNRKEKIVKIIFFVCNIFVISINLANATIEHNLSKEEYRQCIGVNFYEEYVLIFYEDDKTFITHNEIMEDSSEMVYLRKEWIAEKLGTPEETLSFLGIKKERFGDIIKIYSECDGGHKNIRRVIVLK